MAQFTLRSRAFEHGTPIPSQYSCDGKDLSPPLSWIGAPEKTESFALILDDPDAPRKNFAHWIVFDLPARSMGLREGVPARPAIAQGGHQGFNDFGNVGYGGPCPPSGIHSYVFTLYALNGKLGLLGRVTRQDLIQAMKGHILGQAQLIGRYGRK